MRTPRVDVVAVELDTPLDAVWRRFAESEHSRMPIYRETLDDPQGWRRVGVSTKVPNLLATIRTVRSKGGRVEHVYDY